MRKRGINLVELLAVLGILAVVGVVLYPVVARANTNAKRTTCMANLRHISLASQLYSSNSNDVLTPMVLGDQSYDKLLEPYVMINTAWTCPSLATSWEDRTRTIGMNRALGLDLRIPGKAPVSNSVVEFPSQVISFVDDVPQAPGTLPKAPSFTPHVTNACELVRERQSGTDSSSAYDFALTRHGDRANYAFVDGSVKAMRPEDSLFPNVKWFANRPGFASFVEKSKLDEGDCKTVGMKGSPTGRDPITGS